MGDNDFAVWESFAKGKATGGYNVGGLIGNSYWLVWDCYADVAVTGQEVVGGLIGIMTVRSATLTQRAL
ncbi:MAG: hypothetical protein ACOX2S_09340 [bacterium]